MVRPLRQSLVPTPSPADHTGVGLAFVLRQRMCSGEPGALVAHARFRPGGGKATSHPYRTQFLPLDDTVLTVVSVSLPIGPASTGPECTATGPLRPGGRGCWRPWEPRS